MTDLQSGKLRLITWLSMAVLASVRLEIASILAAATLCWFEIPLLRLGYPNQFLSDVVLLGLMSGSVANIQCRKSCSKIGFNWTRHPVGFALGFAIPLAFSQLIVSTIELHQISALGWNLRGFVSGISSHLYDWAIERDYLHRFSAVNAWIVHFLVAVFFVNATQNGVISTKKLLRGFTFGIWPVTLYALGQMIGILPYVFTTDIGGTLQNGNLLSYVGALALFAQIFLIAREKPKPNLWLSGFMISTAFLSIFALIIGVGRISWISTLMAGMMFLPLLGKNLAELFRRLKDHLAIVVFLCVAVAGLIFWTSPLQIGTFRSAMIETSEIISSPSFVRLITAGGRMEHYTRALELWQDKFFYGIGLDSFFLKARLHLDIHNIWLKWGTELGVVGFLIAVIASIRAILMIVRIWLRMNFLNISAAALGVVALFPALGDSTLNYKSMLAACTLCILPLTQQDLLSRPITGKAADSLPSKFVMATLFAIFMWGLSSFSNPQSLVGFTESYETERDALAPGGYRSWVQMATLVLREKSQSCQSVTIHPLLSGKEYEFKFGSFTDADPRPSSKGTITDLLNFEKTLSSTLSTFSLPGGQWHTRCFCWPENSKSSHLYIRSLSGDVIGFSRNSLGPDFRFVSFGIATKAPLMASTNDTSQCIQMK